MADLRPVYVYVKTPATLHGIKQDDLFSIDPVNEEDRANVDPDVVFRAVKDAKSVKGKPQTAEIEGAQLLMPSQFLKLEPLPFNREQLLELHANVSAQLASLAAGEALTDLLEQKASLKGYRYMIYEEEGDGFRFAWSSRTKGFIDDGYIDEMSDLLHAVLDLIPHQGETNSCTYEIDEVNIPEIKTLMKKLGIQQDRPQWK